jgi:septum formation inhibitor-activating ATPase MinD
MSKVVNKTVNLNLIGVNGNAYAIMGAFQRQAKKENWTQEEIDKVITEAKSSDYNHLLCTISDHCEPVEEF